MKALFNFVGDTVHILYLLAMAGISLSLNTVIFLLQSTAFVIGQGANMYGTLIGAYAARIKAVVDKPLTPRIVPGETLH